MEKANKGTIQCAGESCSFMGQKKSVVLSSLFVFVSCFTTPVDSTIRVISLNGNETVYTIQERALILRSADGLEVCPFELFLASRINDTQVFSFISEIIYMIFVKTGSISESLSKQCVQ
jgi:hypothetical protein